jgi:hypothetical protein
VSGEAIAGPQHSSSAPQFDVRRVAEATGAGDNHPGFRRSHPFAPAPLPIAPIGSSARHSGGHPQGTVTVRLRTVRSQLLRGRVDRWIPPENAGKDLKPMRPGSPEELGVVSARLSHMEPLDTVP